MHNVGRVSDAIDNLASELDLKANDWAWWDDAYEFVDTLSDDLLKSDFGLDVLANSKLTAIVFVNASGTVVFKSAVDFNTRQEISADSFAEHVQSHDPLRLRLTPESYEKGLIMLPEGPMLVASRAILTSEREGPVNGALVFGKKLDQEIIDTIGHLTHLTVSIFPYNGTNLPADVALAKQQASESTHTFVHPISRTTIAGYKMLFDVYDEPILIVRVETPREIYNQGASTLQTFVIIIGASLLVFGILTILLIRKLIVERFMRLNNEVQHIGDTRDLSTRVYEGVSDEVGAVARVINTMIAKLHDAQTIERTSMEKELAHTQEVKAHAAEVERINKLMTDRELRIMELKKENAELKATLGKT